MSSVWEINTFIFFSKWQFRTTSWKILIASKNQKTKLQGEKIDFFLNWIICKKCTWVGPFKSTSKLLFLWCQKLITKLWNLQKAKSNYLFIKFMYVAVFYDMNIQNATCFLQLCNHYMNIELHFHLINIPNSSSYNLF